MQQLSVQELRRWMDEGRDFVLIDVREPHEHTAYNIGGLNLPLGEVVAARSQFGPDKDIVLYCEKGIRSVIACQRLEGYGIEWLYNMAGGIKAWRAAEKG